MTANYDLGAELYLSAPDAPENSPGAVEAANVRYAQEHGLCMECFQRKMVVDGLCQSCYDLLSEDADAAYDAWAERDEAQYWDRVRYDDNDRPYIPQVSR